MQLIMNSKFRVFVLLIQVMLVAYGCCISPESEIGVISLDKDQASEVGAVAEKSSENDKNTDLDDEELTISFVDCMRSEGFNVSDPTLNADGTVDLSEIRKSIAQNPDFDIRDSKTLNSLDKCLPILEDATFAQIPSQEDEIEFQDNLLRFAECVRSQGIEIPDPDFSEGPRVAITKMLSSIDVGNTIVQENIEECSQKYFGDR